jgi:hypothetical protein
MTTVDELRDVLQGQRTRVADLRERVSAVSPPRPRLAVLPTPF